MIKKIRIKRVYVREVKRGKEEEDDDEEDKNKKKIVPGTD